MPDICVATTAATCGHSQTGSSKVTIGGKGVCRVETDTAAGLIIGPGSQNVFVEGDKVSLPGDAITTHGKSPHSSAQTNAGQSTVTAGTGFAVDQPDTTGDAPSPNLETTSFAASLEELHASGQGYYPPTNMQAAYNHCYPGGVGVIDYPPPHNVTYSYTIENNGNDTAQPFVVGFWRFLDGANAPNTAILTLNSLEFYPEVELLAEQSVGSMPPGSTYSNTFQYNDLYYPNVGTYAFGIYADIYNTATEPDENNSLPTITITVDNNCG